MSMMLLQKDVSIIALEAGYLKRLSVDTTNAFVN